MSLSALGATAKGLRRFTVPVLVMSVVLVNVDYSTFLSGAWHSSSWDATAYYHISTGFRAGESLRSVFADVPNVHAYRWVLPAIIGVLPFDIDWSFLGASILLSVTLSVFLFHLLHQERVPMPVLLPVFLMVTLYQYYLKFLVFDPFQVSDALFAVSVVLITLGTTRGKFWSTLVACVLGALGRQTALVFLPYLAYCAMVKRISWIEAVTGGATTVAVFLSLFAVSQGDLTALLRFLDPGGGGGTGLGGWVSSAHFLPLCFGPIVYVLAMVAGLRPGEFLRSVKLQGHLLVLTSLIVFQPIVALSISGEGVMRLTAFALPPLALFTALLLARVVSPKWYGWPLLTAALTIECLAGYQQPAIRVGLPYTFLLMNVLMLVGVLAGALPAGSQLWFLTRNRTAAE